MPTKGWFLKYEQYCITLKSNYHEKTMAYFPADDIRRDRNFNDKLQKRKG